MIPSLFLSHFKFFSRTFIFLFHSAAAIFFLRPIVFCIKYSLYTPANIFDCIPVPSPEFSNWAASWAGRSSPRVPVNLTIYKGIRFL